MFGDASVCFLNVLDALVYISMCMYAPSCFDISYTSIILSYILHMRDQTYPRKEIKRKDIRDHSQNLFICYWEKYEHQSE